MTVFFSSKEIRSEDIKVGDILRVEEDDSFPCDLVLLSAANDEGKCFITTANLDGETNLKVSRPLHPVRSAQRRNYMVPAFRLITVHARRAR